MQSSPPLPASLNGHVMVCEGIVHVSEEVRRTPELLSFLSYCSRRGISEQKIVNPAQFQKLRVARGQARTESDVQALAVELIRTAHALGASDIHVEDHGPFVSVDLRILTMVQRHRVLMGDEGRALIRCIYQTMSASAEAQYSPGKRQDGRIISRNYLPPGCTRSVCTRSLWNARSATRVSEPFWQCDCCTIPPMPRGLCPPA